MRISWMFMFFMVCKSSQAQSDCSCDRNDFKIQDSANDNVTVVCPQLEPNDQELIFCLLKDKEEIRRCRQKSNCNGTWNAVELHQSGSHWFFKLQSRHDIRGLYLCTITKEYPPPLQTKQGTPVLVKEFPHPSPKPTHNPTGAPPNTCQEFPWIWIMVIGVVSIYGVIVTIAALFNWLKMKDTENQSDYMNTKPRAPRDRKKKKGLQNIQRHF